MRLAVTGHRPEKIGGYDENNPLAIAIKHHMRETLKKYDDEYIVSGEGLTVYSGMALGIDQWWAEAAIELGITFVAAIPFKGMELKWPEASQNRFNDILKRAVIIKYVCEPGYAAWKMQQRNQYMVDNCHELIAYWDGSKGGTANCVSYANTVKTKVTIVNPKMIGASNGI